MTKSDGAAGTVLRSKVKAAEDALETARREYKSQLDLDPSRLDDNTWASEWAKRIDSAQRTVLKFTQMQDMYEGNMTTPEDEPDRGTRGERVSAGLGQMKETLLRAAKQGVASAVVKQVAAEALIALGDNCPPMLMMLPEPVREAALCAIVYMATQAYPGIPMSGEAAAVSLLALEATASKSFAEATEVLTPRLAGMFKNLGMLPAAAGAGLLLAASKE